MARHLSTPLLSRITEDLYIWTSRSVSHFLDLSRSVYTFVARHLSTPLSVEIYCTSIYRFCAIRFSFLLISLSIALSPHLPNHSLSLQTFFPSDFQAFSRFSLHLVCLFSLIYIHFMFWNLGFRVFEKFWIDELLLKFWNEFLLKWV